METADLIGQSASALPSTNSYIDLFRYSESIVPSSVTHAARHKSRASRIKRLPLVEDADQMSSTTE